MQSAPIKHSEVLLEFMAGEQEKLIRTVESSDFYQELQKNQGKADSVAAPQALDSPKSLSQALDDIALSGKERLFQYTELGKNSISAAAKDSNVQKTANSVLSASADLPLTLAQWNQARKLAFTDAMTLDKVLVQLNLPAGTRDACKAAEAADGSISLKDFSTILDQAQMPPGGSLLDGKAAVADVQALLASLRLSRNTTLSKFKELKLKQAGSYNLNEFRSLLKTIVQESAKDQLKQDLEQPARTQYSAALDYKGMPLSSSSTANDQFTSETQNLVANLIPSFLEEDEEKKRNGVTADLRTEKAISLFT
jgi:hypothetical protein